MEMPPLWPGDQMCYVSMVLGYCYNHVKNKKSSQNETSVSYGEAEVPYKQPYIELFGDLKKLLIYDEISHIDVVELYKVIHFALREDCILCNNNKEIEELRNQTKIIYKKLRFIMKSENITLNDTDIFGRTFSLSDKFMKAALKNTEKALKTTEKIPANLTAKVDYNSAIYISANITTTTTTTSTTTSTTATTGDPKY